MTTYLQDNEGKFIPATKRPDGTWRKARRVKEGYVPQEEVPLYESKGKKFAERKNGLPPGMCPIIAEAAKKEREKKERAKANNAKKQQQIPGVLVLTSEKVATTAYDTNKHKPTTSIDALAKSVDSNLKIDTDAELDTTKQLRKLRKKLREIESIEAKIASGDLRKPEKDQLDKVKRKKEVLKEIEQLELEITRTNSCFATITH